MLAMWPIAHLALGVCLLPDWGQPPSLGGAHLLGAQASDFLWLGLPALALAGGVYPPSLRTLPVVYGATAGTLVIATTLPAIWAAPLHVGGALGTWAVVLVVLWAAPRRSPLGVGGATLGGFFLLLGLLWNAAQGGVGWVWDWIEAAPACLLAGLIGAAHGWARLVYLPPVLLYGALLQLGRGALTLSLHHAQPPQGGYNHAGRGTGAGGTYLIPPMLAVAGGCLLVVGISREGCLGRGRGVEPRPPGPILPHLRLGGGGLLLVLAPWVGGGVPLAFGGGGGAPFGRGPA